MDAELRLPLIRIRLLIVLKAKPGKMNQLLYSSLDVESCNFVLSDDLFFLFMKRFIWFAWSQESESPKVSGRIIFICLKKEKELGWIQLLGRRREIPIP